MKVKAQGVINAVRWIRERRGDAVLARVLDSCSPETRAVIDAGIAINWHPVEQFIELLEAAEHELGSGGGEIAREIGAHGARANLGRPLLKAAFLIARPATLMRRIAKAWCKYNDEGEMRVLEFDRSHMVIEVAGITTPNSLFCCTITGWIYEVGRAFKVKAPEVDHRQCRGRGGRRCIWVAQFGSISD